jgi:hypothetical protein
MFLPVVLRGAICCTGDAVCMHRQISALRRLDRMALGFGPKIPGGSYPEKQSRKTTLR